MHAHGRGGALPRFSRDPSEDPLQLQQPLQPKDRPPPEPKGASGGMRLVSEEEILQEREYWSQKILDQVTHALALKKADDVPNKPSVSPMAISDASHDLNLRLKAVEKLMAEDADKAAYAVVQIGQLHELLTSVKDELSTVSTRLKEERQERLSGLQDVAKLAEMAVKTTSCIVDGGAVSEHGTAMPNSVPPPEDRDQIWDEVSSRIRSVMTEMRDDIGRELHLTLFTELSAEIGRKMSNMQKNLQMHNKNLAGCLESSMGDVCAKLTGMEGKVSECLQLGSRVRAIETNMSTPGVHVSQCNASFEPPARSLSLSHTPQAERRESSVGISQFPNSVVSTTSGEALSESSSRQLPRYEHDAQLTEDPNGFMVQTQSIREKLSRISMGDDLDMDSKQLMEEADVQMAQIPLINKSVKEEMQNLALSVGKILAYNEKHNPQRGQAARSPSTHSKPSGAAATGNASEARDIDVSPRSQLQPVLQSRPQPPQIQRKDKQGMEESPGATHGPPKARLPSRQARQTSPTTSLAPSLRAESRLSESEREAPSLPRYAMDGQRTGSVTVPSRGVVARQQAKGSPAPVPRQTSPGAPDRGAFLPNGPMQFHSTLSNPRSTLAPSPTAGPRNAPPGPAPSQSSNVSRNVYQR